MYINRNQTIPQVWLGYDFICQTIPWVQFCYDLRTPTHTLGIVWHGGMGLPVTPVCVSLLDTTHNSHSFCLCFLLITLFFIFFHVCAAEYRYFDENFGYDSLDGIVYTDGLAYDSDLVFESAEIQPPGSPGLGQDLKQDEEMTVDVTGSSGGRLLQKIARIRSAFPEAWIWTELRARYLLYFMPNQIRMCFCFVTLLLRMSYSPVCPCATKC